MKTIPEPSRELEIKGEYDVIAAGGGVAGVSAALSAARQGARVLLLEKQYVLGGLATAGLVTIYLPLCDGEGRQVSFSIAEELLRLSITYGAEDKFPLPWLRGGTAEEKKLRRFEVRYNANLFAVLLERLLKENGVHILYGTSVSASLVSGDRIQALVVENKSGRSAYACGSVVDCTGDADICFLSGEDTALFRQGNLLASWYYFVEKGRFDLRMLGYADVPEKYKLSGEKREQKRYGGLSAEEVTGMVMDSHQNVLEDYVSRFEKSEQETALAAIASIPQVRMTRRLKGCYELDDTEMHREFGDSIGLVSDWRKPGPVYEIPFSTLHGRKIGNLLAAGRCISVTDAMWDITRVIPDCAVTGEAAGAAAAMGGDFRSFPVEELQKLLLGRGVVLHEKML